MAVTLTDDVYRQRKIDKVRLLQMIQDKVQTKDQAAAFGVSVPALLKTRKRMLKKMAEFSDPSENRGDLDGGGSIDAMKQLKDINQTIINELERCKRFIDKEDKGLLELEKLEVEVKMNPSNTALAKRLKEESGLTYNGILKIQANVLAIAGEVRKQVELQLKIAETLYSVTMMAEFQEEVVAVLKDVSPEVRDLVVKKLRERRALRGVLKAT